MKETFDIVIGGNADEFAAEGKRAVQEINAIDASTARVEARERKLGVMREQLASLQRRARKDQFDQLPLEERINKLLERREQLQERISRSSGNERRMVALNLAQGLNTQQLTGLQKQVKPPPPPPPVAGGMFGQAAAQIGGVFRSMFSQMMGAFGVQAVISRLAGKHDELIAYGSRTKKLSNRAQISTTSFQEFDFAAGQTESSGEEVGKAIKKMALAQRVAARGKGAKRKAFDDFGISLDELKTKSVDELYLQIARNAAKGGKSIAGMSQAMEIFGQVGDRVLSSFREGFASEVVRFREMGGAIDEDVIQQLDDAGDKAEEISLRINNALAPIVLVWDKIKNGIAAAAEQVRFFGGLLGARVGGASAEQAGEQVDDPRLKKEVAAEEKKNAKIIEEKRRAFKQLQLAEEQAELDSELGYEQANPGYKSPFVTEIRTNIEALNDEINPKPVDYEGLSRIADLKEKINEKEKEAAFAVLTTQEKINDLKKRSADLGREMAATTDEEERANKRLEQLGLEKEARGLKLDQPNDPVIAHADELARVGGFQGVQSNNSASPQMAVAREQNTLVRETNVKMDKLITTVGGRLKVEGISQ